jgi:Family of unknown function (DUF6152)
MIAKMRKPMIAMRALSRPSSKLAEYPMKTLMFRALRVATASVAMAAGLVGFGVTPAAAHHSFAGFDKTKVVTLKGTVKQWQFMNPHSWLTITVVEDGKEVQYALEGSSVNTLAHRGWGRNTFKAGEKLTVEMYPLYSGEKGGAFLKATFEDGRTLSSGITPN